ncbi:MAG: PmoA family protein [Planctomycetia bacterium]|nr:PmoA family protein [Planctomycetia bacterium]
MKNVWWMGLIFFTGTLFAETPFRVEEQEGGAIALYENDAPLWVYQYRQKVHDWVAPTDRRRVAGCYFHPLYGIHSEVLTNNASTWDNHQHHHGLWTSFFTFIVHEKDGSQTAYDTWTDEGPVKKDFVSWGEKIASDDAYTFTVHNACFLYKDGKPVRKYLDETLKATTHKTQKDTNQGATRTLDLEYTWTACDNAVTLAGDRRNGKNFSSLAIRFVKPEKKTIITGPQGEIVGDPLRCETPWASYREDGSTRSCVTLYSDPANPTHPGGMAIRHYGMLVTGWPGTEGITLQPGQSVTLKYRVVVQN